MRLLGFLLFVGLATAADPVYLALLKGANALVYLTPSGNVLAKVPVGEHPHEMVFSPDRKYLYTTDNGTMRIEHAGKGGNTVSIIDVAARRKVGNIVLGEYYRPHGIAIDAKTGMLAVTTENPDQLLIVDPAKRSVVKHFNTQGKTPHMVTFGPGGTWAYVSHSQSGTVAAVHVQTGETKLIRTGDRPEGSVLSPDGKELYVVNRDSNSISVIETTKNTVIATIQTGKGPVRIALAPDGRTAAYAMQLDKKVGLADLKARTQTDYVIVPGEPVSCHLSHDGKLAFVSTETTDTIYVVDVASKKIAGDIKLAEGSAPDPVVDMPAR